VLLDESERILHANRKAEETLRQRRGLQQVQDRLGATGAGDSPRLRYTLALARSRALTGKAPVPETLLLSAAPGDPQLLVVACPIPPRQAHFRGPWPEAAVAVYVSNLADAGLLNHEILMHLYGLTEREAHLACALARGHDLAELSAAWGVSRETLRTHLKRVLGKTGTDRQAELVRLLSGRPWNLVHPMDPLAASH
jgi:DNA-binding CsgD family transcriptional regulator